MWKQIALVALGGGAGSVLRYLVSVWSSRYFLPVFPWGTFIVNITGCFIIGVLIGFLSRFGSLENEMRLLLVVGFCGGYTTFSAFSTETLKLLEAGNCILLALYIVASILLGVIAVWGGVGLSKMIIQ